ncbi:hypothetical protein [Nonomuraea longicatena]|uniref:hypothetical protein n=1 Tax=Nonomuraea longicatena TaxID=83682 RepID=UPI0031D5FBDF
MSVEIWSEIACPRCGLDSHRLDRAVERFEHGDKVEVIHRSFRLSDGFTVGSTVSARLFDLDDLLGLAGEIGLEREKTQRVVTGGRFG